MVAYVGIPSSALGIWQSDNILAPLSGNENTNFLWVYEKYVSKIDPLDDRIEFHKADFIIVVPHSRSGFYKIYQSESRP